MVCLSYINIIFADDESENINFNEVNKVIETAAKVEDLPKINSRYAVVIDKNNKTVIYGKNENTKTKMASTTKIMTCLVVLENANLRDIVETSAKAAGTGGSKLKFKKGDKISVNDLLYGLMLRSGNDAAVALAEHVGGSIEVFATLMNKKAVELGLKNTHFETPHGLDSDNHYTTPYELALLTAYALENNIFKTIVGTKSCSININGIPRTIFNTNELLGNLNGVYGVKTGFTNGAGRCLVTAIKRENLDAICVVLGADTKKDRTADSVKLIEYTFKNYESINISNKINEEFEKWKSVNEKRIVIKKGIKPSTKIKLDEYNIKTYPIKKNSENDIKIEINGNLNINAPVRKNTKIGELKVFYDDKCISEIDILTNENIREKTVFDYIYEMIKDYNKYLKRAVEN
jgi:serine-type D-Ala-D-Ala carboxypeptidase (penicillin-binding protein 5/6)